LAWSEITSQDLADKMALSSKIQIGFSETKGISVQSFLFEDVLHHQLAVSDVYDFNSPYNQWTLILVTKMLQSFCKCWTSNLQVLLSP
jgi:hypothetical protein